MAGDKKIYIIAGVIVVAALLVGGFIFYSGQDKSAIQDRSAEKEEDTPYEVLAEDNGVVLMADTGLDVDWIDGDRTKGRQVFERYRIVSREDFESFTGTEFIVDSLDITEDNAEVLLTYPDEIQEEVAGDVNYVLFPLVPGYGQAGEYTLDVKLNSGEEYHFVFERESSKEVELTDTGKTIIQQKPEQKEGVTLSDRELSLLNILEDTQRESRKLHAFKLGNLDLTNASNVLYVVPGGAVYGGAVPAAREVVYIDEYFWLDTEQFNNEYNLDQEFIQLAKGIENPDPDVVQELERLEAKTGQKYIFLAMIDGTWHYAIKNPPF